MLFVTYVSRVAAYRSLLQTQISPPPPSHLQYDFRAAESAKDAMHSTSVMNRPVSLSGTFLCDKGRIFT